MEDKLEELKKYSDPLQVAKMGDKYIKGTPIYISTRKDKKYMVEAPDGKWIHFGQMGYKDGTLMDKERNQRRDRFRKRNHKWSASDKWTPAYLSYWILWT
jgi:hypothetical protein